MSHCDPISSYTYLLLFFIPDYFYHLDLSEVQWIKYNFIRCNLKRISAAAVILHKPLQL